MTCIQGWTSTRRRVFQGGFTEVTITEGRHRGEPLRSRWGHHRCESTMSSCSQTTHFATFFASLVKKMNGPILVLGTLGTIALSAWVERKTSLMKAICVFDRTVSTALGHVNIESLGSRTKFVCHLSNLTGLHGFHVHRSGNTCWVQVYLRSL